MKKTLLAMAVGSTALATQPGLANAAGFIEDSSARLDLRNFYYNHDYRDVDKESVREWGQAFVLNVQSGYTPGTLGVGVDAIATLGVKLDAPGQGSVFPEDTDSKGRAEAADEFSRGGLTGKLRFLKTEARYGILQPKLPILTSNDARLLPQLFEGGIITSNDIDGLTLTAGQIEHVVGRMSSNFTGMAVAGGLEQSNKFLFAGGDYKGIKDLTLQYYYANLEDYYKQHFVGALHTLPLAPGQVFKTDLRYFHTGSDGANADGKAGYRTSGYTRGGDGEIDNNTWSAMFTYGLGGHAFSLGYQEVSDGSNFVQLNQGSLPGEGAGGTSLYLITDRLTASFNYAGERTVLGQYVYDFAALGVPGLNLNLAYLKGDQIKRAGASDAKEWERDLVLSYVIQAGPLKNLGVAWRNSMLRSEVGGDADHNRLTVSYSLPIW
ncbi:OprD family porin [Pseudomonas sp. PSKL.D1]|uniref:OprD family porin n=1 Tax=Pseudomonas sp. PSKL.D1 TaxID=3029060 RepID=UPI0023817EA0|nr:OprD family porin [Pseudomonas sp. PSKL.D1]WDY59569.1 OprD family porin [Pseudomonas sp. PSKL.D1]